MTTSEAVDLLYDWETPLSTNQRLDIAEILEHLADIADA